MVRKRGKPPGYGKTVRPVVFSGKLVIFYQTRKPPVTPRELAMHEISEGINAGSMTRVKS